MEKVLLEVETLGGLRIKAGEKILLEQGKSVEIDGCVSKKGNVFSCKVHYGKNDKGQMGIIPEFN